MNDPVNCVHCGKEPKLIVIPEVNGDNYNYQYSIAKIVHVCGDFIITTSRQLGSWDKDNRKHLYLPTEEGLREVTDKWNTWNDLPVI